MQNDRISKKSGSEPKNLGEELQLYKNLINQSNDAIFVIDPGTSRLLYVNDKVLSNLGYGRKELLKMTMMDIEEVIQDRSSWDEHVKEAQKNGYMILLGKHKRKNGSTFSVEINAKYIAQDERDYMIVVTRDITERKVAEKVIDKALTKAAQAEQLERELHSLEQLSDFPKISMTARAFGIKPLNESAPEIFNELVTDYNNLLDLSLEQRSYKVEYDISDELRTIANKLGFLKVGPREVVSIHSAALKQKVKDVSNKKWQAYMEEGRLRILELMGYLVSYYRSYSTFSGSLSNSGLQINEDNRKNKYKKKPRKEKQKGGRL